jgi:hypothetical protein
MVGHAEQGIGKAVIADVNHDIQVIAPYGLKYQPLSLAGAKSWCNGI